MNTHTIAAQLFVAQASAAPAAGAAESPSWMPLLAYLLLFAAMYFFLFAPARKAQKEREKIQSGLQSGDNVITSTGIYGRVVGISDDRVTLELESGRMAVHKSAIAGKAEDGGKVLQA